MIAKVALFLTVVAAVHATTLLHSGLVAPGLSNSGILAPGLLNSGIWAPGLSLKGAPLLSAPIGVIPSSVATRSVVAIPGAITTDKRVIGTSGIIAGAPLLSNGIISNGLIRTPIGLSNGIISPIGLSNGIISPIGLNNAIISPIGLSNGIISPIGLRSTTLLGAPLVKTILK